MAWLLDLWFLMGLLGLAGLLGSVAMFRVATAVAMGDLSEARYLSAVLCSLLLAGVGGTASMVWAITTIGALVKLAP